MGRIIQMQGDPHHQTQTLLPWYVNGSLDAHEVGLVEAHLEQCTECQTELRSERALGSQMASLPMDVELGWAVLRQKVNAAPRQQPMAPLLQVLRRPISVGWALAAQIAAAAVILAADLPAYLSPNGFSSERPTYQALGSTSAAPTGNLIVLFRPDASERGMRDMLVQTGARVVDGPTASGAYVLQVADENRATALKQFRAAHQVLLAEPIDAGGRQR